MLGSNILAFSPILQEVQFKLQSRVRIFSADVNTKPNCQLVATASAFGLVFVASPQPELKGKENFSILCFPGSF